MKIDNIPDNMIQDDIPISFSLTDYGDTGMHTHSFVEVFYIISGQISHSFSGGSVTALKAGDMAIIPVGTAHSFFRDGNTECVHRDIGLRSGFFEKVCDFLDPQLKTELFEKRTPCVLRISQDTVRRFEQSVSRITRLMPTASANRLPLITAFAVTLAEQVACDRTESLFDSMPVWFRHLLDEFNRPESIRQGLDYIVSRVDYDRKYLCKVFKKKMGVTMTEYLNHMRLMYAYNMLQSTDANVLEVAHSVGFSSVSYFNVCFKKQFGTTPGHIRTVKS